MRNSYVVAITCLALASCVATNLNCICNPKASEQAAKKAAEKAIEATSGGKSKVDLGGATGGNVDISGLPEFMRYPGARAMARWSMTGEHGMGTNYVFETPDAPATVRDFYKKAFAGWKTSMTLEGEGQTVLSYGSPDEKQWAVVSIGKDQDSDKTALNILYSRKE